MYKKITIISSKRPESTNINDQLQWIGGSLGLFNLRDKDKSCFRVFITLMKAGKRNEALSSDELAMRLNLSRGTVVHHLNKLMEAGIVIPTDNTYAMRMNTLQDLVDSVEKDLKIMCDELRDIASQVDEKLQ